MRILTRLWTLPVFLTAGLAMLAASPNPASAANFVVNSTGDQPDVDPTVIDGICEIAPDGSGVCTLRAALEQANVDNDTDTITFDPTVFPAGGGTTINTTSELLLEDPVTITGPGADALTVSNDGSSRVFRIEHGLPDAGPHAISGMTITGGDGGIAVCHIEDGVTLDRLKIAGNHDTTDGGGGVLVAASTLCTLPSVTGQTVTIKNSTIDGNTSASAGGGVRASDTATVAIENCTISGNSANSGGGLSNLTGSSTTITASTFFDNEAIATNGGGIRNNNTDSTVTITNSTISGNRASLDGGGISNDNNTNAVVSLVNSTVTGNTADAEADGSGDGGGISNADGAGVNTNAIHLTNTIVAGNLDNSAGAEAPDCDAPTDNAGDVGVHSMGNNLLGDDTGCTNNDLDVDPAVRNDQIGVDPLLAALSPVDGGDPANGGLTGVHVPGTGSPAIDGVDATIAAAPAEDQRGTTRPLGAASDIGSVETGCGNDILEAGEECDDGDTTSGDGCSATCQTEDGGTTGGTTGGTGGDGDGGGCSLIR